MDRRLVFLYTIVSIEIQLNSLNTSFAKNSCLIKSYRIIVALIQLI